MELGYRDGLAAREQILHLLGHDDLLAEQDHDQVTAKVSGD
jgi:hypothetical protein